MAPLSHAGPLPRGATGEVSIAMVRRDWIVASLALLLGAGCHAGAPPKLAKTEPPITQSDVSAARFIALHNQNADAIQAIKASPNIVVLGEQVGRVNGHLAFERDKNFRLELDGPMRHTVADIGSNDTGFWFWVEDKKEKSIYVCDHKDINSCQLAVTLQPDWIIEVMGLRRFSEDEARKVHAKPGEQPGTLVLTQFRKDAKGQTYTKETIVNESSGHILQHKLYLGAKKELIASATIGNYIEQRPKVSPAKTRELGEDAAVAQAETFIRTPERFRLNWIKEDLAIEIVMSRPDINPTYKEKERVALFTEPRIPGTTRRDLAQLDPNIAPASSRVYESRPIPNSGGIRLGTPQPSPLGVEGTTRRAIDPVPLSADLSSTPAQPAGVVGALVPTASDPNTVQIGNLGRWRSPSIAR